MSAWGGPKRRRINAVIGFIGLASVGLMIAGLKASAISIGLGMSLLMFFIPLASGPSQAIFQTKVAPEVQGRVFAIRSMISRSAMPLAFLLAGPLADKVFNPMLEEGGLLANTVIGRTLGVDPGRGIGLIFVCSGIALLIATAVAYANPRIRNVEEELPDALPDTVDKLEKQTDLHDSGEAPEMTAD